MPLVMDLGGARLTYTDGVWIPANPRDSAVADTVNDLMDEPPGVTAADPYPALANAKRIARQLNGTIVDEGNPPDFDPDVVY